MSAPAKRDLTTSIRDPWCLVYRGGAGEGRRPSTRMAYLKSAVPGTNGDSLMGYLMNHDCTSWTLSVRRIERADIAKRFRGWHQPVPAAIRKAVRAIPKAEARAQ